MKVGLDIREHTLSEMKSEAERRKMTLSKYVTYLHEREFMIQLELKHLRKMPR